jgi:integrase
MQAIVAFAYITGWRTPSEILPLEWRQVDLTAGEVRLDAGTTKNGDGRVFPFTRELRRVLEEQHEVAKQWERAHGPILRHVFCYTTGPKAGQRITESGFNKAWRKARVDAGCPGRIPHDFRRTAVRNLVRAGVPERVAMQLTGHKTRAVFERYNIVSPGDLCDAARRLDTYAARAAS